MPPANPPPPHCCSAHYAVLPWSLSGRPYALLPDPPGLHLGHQAPLIAGLSPPPPVTLPGLSALPPEQEEEAGPAPAGGWRPRGAAGPGHRVCRAGECAERVCRVCTQGCAWGSWQPSRKSPKAAAWSLPRNPQSPLFDPQNGLEENIVLQQKAHGEQHPFQASWGAPPGQPLGAPGLQGGFGAEGGVACPDSFLRGVCTRQPR